MGLGLRLVTVSRTLSYKSINVHEEKEGCHEPAKIKIKGVIEGTLAGLSLERKKQNPAARRAHAVLGKVIKRRLRRPNVSIFCHGINELKTRTKEYSPIHTPNWSKASTVHS